MTTSGHIRLIGLLYEVPASIRSRKYLQVFERPSLTIMKQEGTAQQMPYGQRRKAVQRSSFSSLFELAQEVQQGPAEAAEDAKLPYEALQRSFFN